MKNNLIFGAIVVVISVVLSSFLIKPVQNVTNQVLGAAGGSTFNQSDLTVGGVTEFRTQTALTLSTSTPCAIQSPSATSTLFRAQLRVASTSASATYLEFGKATSAYATTTSLGIATLGANAQGTFTFATATLATNLIDQPFVFAPNTWFVAKIAGNTQISGVCQTMFVAI
jgi:hypothetical protein